MNLKEPFETKRMKFRLLEMRDVDAVYRQFSDPDMCKYFSEPPVNYEEAESIIQHYSNPEGAGHLRYGMFDKATGDFIGTCGYHYLDQKLGQVEIGYDIWKEYWKKGYISEALPVLLDICFNYHHIDCVYILSHPENIASHASVRKFGFVTCEPCRSIESNELCMKLLKSDWNRHA